MRALARTMLAAGLVILSLTGVTSAQQSPVPDRRFVLLENTDLPGGDLQTILDTTVEACERACLANDRCTALTFNSRNGSCFPKAGSGEPAPYAGAYSGYVLTTDPAVLAEAPQRRAELTFLGDYDIGQARAQAEGLANAHVTGTFTAEEHLQSAAEAEAQGNYADAASYVGAALNLTDSPDGWAEYARLLFEAGRPDSQYQRSYRDGALSASINAYLRSANPGQRHTALVIMGQALESIDRGRDTVQALRLAQAIQPRDDTAAMLDDAIGKYGFRITETEVQSDSARPRICATFSEDLADKGVDYSTFVQLTEPGLTVDKGGWRQLCVEGVQHGSRYAVTFREGMPAADGQTLAKSTTITQYVRDRKAQARFPGRTYVLPRAGGASIPVQTVNTRTLDLTLYAVSDRNMLRAIQDGYFSEPMQAYSEESFTGSVGAELWSGTADVGMEVNRDVTTRLPMDEAIKGLPAGIYALRAAAPGNDPYDIAPAWQWFVLSDLGVTTMSGVDGLHVFVRSLADASAKAGVSVDLISRANAILGTATTDDQGYARFDAGLTRGTGGSAPALVTLRDGQNDMAFLSLTDPEFDLSDRGVEGRETAGPVDVFLTTDRGAYRAGETVYATALTRDSEAAAVEDLPLTAILKRPDGLEYSRALADDAGAGGHVFTMPVAGSAPRGVWRIEVYADLDADPLSARTFLVEDFLPERIDFTLGLAEMPLRLGDMADLSVDARYLFGAPGADLAIEGEVLLRAAAGLTAFPGYVFGLQNQPFSAQMAPLDSDLRTNTEGLATIPVALPDVADPARPLEARFTVRVAEGSGRPVEREIIRPLEPTAPMIGIKPLFDGTLSQGAEAKFNLIAVGPGDQPVPAKVKWELTRIDTDYQWYQQFGQWQWEPVTTRTRVAEGTADLTTAPTEIAAQVEWGEFELAVERSDGDFAASSTRFSAGWYGAADATSTPDTLELSLDKPAYRPGETAKLRIVPRAAGTALVTVLSNRLIAMKAVPVAEGENTIDLPVTDEWGAGVYVTASVLRPMDVAAGRNPARALGLSYARIDPGKRQLATRIETTPESAPRGPLDVAVRVAGTVPGETAYVTLAAVDLGILNLTAFESPDPSEYYFGQRKLGVGIRDIYGRLIDGLNGAEGTVRSGGDAGAQARLQAPPPTEQLVAGFVGPLTVDADGLVRATFDMPSFNGTVRLMAVAWTKTGVGQAEADVLVRDPVVVTASLPRFLSPGDESRLLLEIVHATGPSGRMQLGLTSAGLTLGDAPATFDLADKGKAVFSVPVTAITEGIDTIEVNLTTPDGKILTKTLTVPVQNNDPEIARTSRFDLAPGATFLFSQDAFAGLIPGTAKATLAVGPIARLNAPGLLATLDRYPYGCTEQITSKALPLLYFDEVAQVMGLDHAEDLRTRIGQAVDEILTNQSAEGAFGLWNPGQGDPWLDAFVTDFLSRARAQGIEVPDIAFRSALDNLRNQVNYAPDFDSGGEALAYQLMVLAREGAAAIGDLRYYADVKGDAFTTAIGAAQLGAALASYGDQTRADAMFTRAARMTPGLMADETVQVFRADYGTNLRDTAAVLALGIEAGSNAIDRDALTTRIAARNGVMSTQEATWSLLAARALLSTPNAEGVTLNGQPARGPLVRVLDSQTADPIAVANTGNRPATLTVTAFGVPSEPEPAGGNGYAISRSYYTLEGEPASIDSVPVGTRLIAVVEVTPFGSGEARLMVNDPLPAGFEIDNPNLIRGGDIVGMEELDLTSDIAHAEFRQDRFLAAVDRMDSSSFRLGYIVRAISPGTFHQPAASVEDMYRPDFRARSNAGRVTVTE
ncbi:MAG: PAN domain-containing protein [Cereibacter sphaeroides]|uniref:PAN domain-containing protein n=1 Tax=Cereibacter sphaeroides TaxID=1063 RepID=A0A2W5U3H5_CERSP|nr:MAG: PAN domain-containing protein [Cereibacter sphaeroides]